MNSAVNKCNNIQQGGKVDITASVLTVGFFICLQIQEEEKTVLPYSIVQSSNSKWTGSLGLGTLSKLMELAHEECGKIITPGNTTYCYDPKVIPFSQVIVVPTIENSSMTACTTENEMKSKIKGSDLNPRLFYSSNCILSMGNDVLHDLGKALGIKASNINLSDVMLEVENVIIRSGLHGLKTQLDKYQKAPVIISTGNIYLDCMLLIHKLCSVRLLMTYANVDDYSSRLLGIVLTVAGLELQHTSPEHSIVLTWNKEEKENHWALQDILKMIEAKVICAVYPAGSNINLDEIASSLVPMPFSPIADSIASMSKWMMPNPIYTLLRDEYWENSKSTLTQNIEMDFLSWAAETSRNRDVLYLLLLSFAIKRCMQLDIFYMHWKSKLSSDLCMKLTVQEERRLLLDDAQLLGVIHRYPLESFRPNTFTLSPLKGQSKSYIKFMSHILSLLDPTTHLDDISRAMQTLVGEEGDIIEKDHKQYWKEKGLSFPRKIAFKHCTQLTIDRISLLLKGLQMNINASLLLFEMIFHGTLLSHQEISNIIAVDNHVTPPHDNDQKDNPFLSVRTKCKVCYCHAMDTATALFSKSLNVMRQVLKEKLNKSNLTDQEKARVAALVNFKVDEYLPAAIIRILFNKPIATKINTLNSQSLDESMKSSILQWVKVPYMNKCHCDGRPQHDFIRSCLFCGLDAIHAAKSTQLVEIVQNLLFSSFFVHENSDTVVNEFIDFFYCMIKVVLNDMTCSIKNEKKGRRLKGTEHDELSEPNVTNREDESNSDSKTNLKHEKQKISKKVKGDCIFVLDSVEVDGKCNGNEDSYESDEDSDSDTAGTDDLNHDNLNHQDEENTDMIHVANNSDDDYSSSNVERSVDLTLKNKTEVEGTRRLQQAETRLLNRGNPERGAPVHVEEYVPSLSVTQVKEIAKKFDPDGSFSQDLSSFLQWMFSFSTGPSLTIINDFVQHNCNHSANKVTKASKSSITQQNTETTRSNIINGNSDICSNLDVPSSPSCTAISNEEISNTHKTSAADVDQHINHSRNDNTQAISGQIPVLRNKKEQGKSNIGPPIKKAFDRSSASVPEEKLKSKKKKVFDANDKTTTEVPVVKKLKTRDNDRRLFEEFFSKK